MVHLQGVHISIKTRIIHSVMYQYLVRKKGA